MSSKTFQSTWISRDNLVAGVRQQLQQLGHKEDIVDIQFGDLSLELIPIKILTEEQEVRQFKLNGESS